MKNEFFDWLNKSFLTRHGGFFPKFQDRWYNNVEDTHKDLRELIGGVRLNKQITINSKQNPAPINQYGDLADGICKVLPEYLDFYGFDKSIFALPSIPQGNHNVIKLSKHIFNHANVRYHNGLLQSDDLRKIDKLISELGTVWSKNKCNSMTVDVSLSTSHKAFALLGHLGPDNNSCFNQQSDKPQHKYTLGQSKDTFVITVSQYNKEKGKDKNLARCIGFLSYNKKVFHTSNFYFAEGFCEGDFLEILKEFFKSFWQDEVTVAENVNSITNKFYQNEYGIWSFGKGSIRIEPEELRCNAHLISTFVCPHCLRGYKDPSEWYELDNELYCFKCIALANICEITKRKTLLELEPVLNTDNKMVLAHPDVARAMQKCVNCDMPSMRLINVGGEQICNDCIESNYSECDFCGELVNDENLEELENLDICPKCLGNQVVLD